MPGLGVRLQLFVGPTLPLPAPYPVIDSVINIEVTNRDTDFDGFKIVFSLGKDSLLDYGLLMSGVLDPPSRVIIMVFIGGLPQILIDGIITRHQVVPSNRPGESRLHVFGKDITVKLDLEEKNETYPNQPDSVIAMRLIAGYATLGLVPQVTPTTDVPIQLDRIPSQQGHRSGVHKRIGTPQRLCLLHRADVCAWSQYRLLGSREPARHTAAPAEHEHGC